jgi:CHAT domain-containing protein
VSAFALYRVLFEPVEQVLKGKKRVFVVAGGSLAGLPFSMLVTQKPEGADDDPAALRATQWLAERYALVHVPSLYSLALLRGPAGEPAKGGFVGFGDPTLTGQAATRGARRGAAVPAAHEVITAARTPSGGAMANVAALRQMQQLPGTARELKEMAGIFGSSSQVFTRARATEAQVRSADLSQARVIAFATHGLTPADPVGEAQASELYELAEPGLVLTPPREASAEDDGFLSASEVASLRLNADWVILSACNTATGDAATAGLSQLARAFFYAGARNLLASHWPVDDEVAAKMTVRTLALEQAGTPRAEAFQQAMREIRADPAHAEWAHPFYWSPFVLIGDGGK